MTKIYSLNHETLNTSMNGSIRQPKQCRICLQQQGDGQSDEKMIQPCRCSGSVMYVHQKCMKKWILRTIEGKDKQVRGILTKQGIKCQICRWQIKFELKCKLECRKISEVRELIEKKPEFFLVVIFILFLNVAGISAISYAFSQLLFQHVKNKASVLFPLLAVAGILMFLLFLGLGIYLFLTHFLLQQIDDIGSVVCGKTSEMQMQVERGGRLNNSTQIFTSLQ